mmetsp:Transcript_14648/g.37989  ORF Transcript_14648/g.37989 Transcript_14648/m.37989 type:complete len:214 (+) Transcript_14648:325-966(+)
MGPLSPWLPYTVSITLESVPALILRLVWIVMRCFIRAPFARGRRGGRSRRARRLVSGAARTTHFLNSILNRKLLGMRSTAVNTPMMTLAPMLDGSMPKNTAATAVCPRMRQSSTISRCGRVKGSFGCTASTCVTSCSLVMAAPIVCAKVVGSSSSSSAPLVAPSALLGLSGSTSAMLPDFFSASSILPRVRRVSMCEILDSILARARSRQSRR